jgi:hypothetical protein
MSSEADETKPSQVTGVKDEAYHDANHQLASASEHSTELANIPTINETDPALPLNWSIKKKIFNMGIPSLLCFVV